VTTGLGRARTVAALRRSSWQARTRTRTREGGVLSRQDVGYSSL
jgi:hypothetical protein